MINEFIKQYMEEFTPYKTKRWCYEDGILLTAMRDLYLASGDVSYRDFVLNYLDKFIDDSGHAQGYEMDSYSIDDIQPATVLPWAYEETHLAKYQKAMDIFYQHLQGQPRCDCGNFYHKLRYPHQVWMDGLYMGQVFFAEYSIKNHLYENIDDIVSQFANVRKYLFDEKRHLYVHAYDELKIMQWADPETGKAPNVWSRACGWMMMALVDIYEIVHPVLPEKVSFIPKMYQEMVKGLIPYLDEEYHMIHQVVDHIGENGNYLETSGSAMMAYSLMKAHRLGLSEHANKLGTLMFEGITKRYLVQDEKGHISLGGICQVAGLDNERRNGSASYYYSEKIVENEVKGVAPYFMLYSEILKEKN
jgi:unsaturated rhamnogalacturonyl hydrolase